MDGIRICGQPCFAEIFAPILGELSGLNWLTGNNPFRVPLSWFDESVYDEAADSYLSGPCVELDRDFIWLTEKYGASRYEYGNYSRTDIFPKYASIVDEDWNAFFGMDVPVSDPVAWWKDYYDAKNRADYVGDFYVCFLSIDGSFWEFYTKETRLLEILREHLKHLDVAVFPCRLEESAGL